MSKRSPTRPAKRRDTAALISQEALRLFARDGYGSTTVAAIEEAVGLSPGSGAMYRHYRSKEEVLRAAVERYSVELGERITGFGEALEKLESSDLRGQLQLIATITLEGAPGQRDLIRVLFREADSVPHVLCDVRDRFISLTYQGFAAWLRGVECERRIDAAEADALSAVLFGSLLNYWASDALLGETPRGVSKKRFIDTWIETVLHVLES